MTRANNSSFLAQANTRRHEAALAAARHAIEQLRREGRAVSYAAVAAHAAGVSRPWLYRQDQIRDLISQLRDHQLPAAALTAQRATTSSLRQRLDTAQAEIKRLRAGNRCLRDQPRPPPRHPANTERQRRISRPAMTPPTLHPGLPQLHVHATQTINYQARCANDSR